MKKGKGTHGYIHAQTILVIIRTVIYFTLAFGIYALGYYHMHTNKSLWTVIAVLSMLPASKSAVNMIMFLRFRSLKEEDYQNYKTAADCLPALYETVLTTAEKAYFLPMLVCFDNTICGFCKKEQKDLKKLEDYIGETLTKDGIKNSTVKIFEDEKQFLERLHTMNQNFAEKEDTTAASVFATIRAVSL